MGMQEQLEKIIHDQKKLERKKEEFLAEYDEKRKKLLLKKKELEQKMQKEKEGKILQAVQESFGEITEKNMDAFLKLLEKNKEDFSLEMEIALEESEEINGATETNVPNFGTQETAEEHSYVFDGNQV